MDGRIGGVLFVITNMIQRDILLSIAQTEFAGMNWHSGVALIWEAFLEKDMGGAQLGQEEAWMGRWMWAAFALWA